MDTPLNASATSAGALLASNTFVVPPYQREFAWEGDEVKEFWDDLRGGLEQGSYFLGLVILTTEGSELPSETDRKHVVDGQQRILSLSLLASAIYHEAKREGRDALADRVRADFLTSMNYETDLMVPRVVLSEPRDDDTFQTLTTSPTIVTQPDGDESDLSRRLLAASETLRKSLAADLQPDPFKRLGMWADFLTNQVYLAVFVHPDPSTAYRVFEVINTRGRELTTADLLKNYILSQTPDQQRDQRYREWREIAEPLSPQNGPSSLVQFIRHVVTLHAGHVPSRDLFAYLAGRQKVSDDRRPPGVPDLMANLQSQLPLYLQMIDPTVDGPADPVWLGVFAALKDLGVITVRPLLLAIAEVPNPTEGMKKVLQLVVRRIVVGNLGTGNVERRFSEAARLVATTQDWTAPLVELEDLNPTSTEFIEQLRKRSLNKSTLTFLHRSIHQSSTTPEDLGYLHLIRPRQAAGWDAFPQDDFTYWGSTLGNTILARVERRPNGSATWSGVAAHLLPEALSPDDQNMGQLDVWDASSVGERGERLAAVAATVWY